MTVISNINKIDAWFIGEDQDLEWEVFTSDDRTIQDLTGWTIQFRMAISPGGASVLTKAATVIDPTHGLCLVTILAADTASFTPAVYHYTLSRLDSGHNSVIAEGKATLQARVG